MEHAIIPGFDGKYRVSDSGVVETRARWARGVWRPLAVAISNGYPQVVLFHNKRRHAKKIHRMVAELFVINGDCANKTEVNHKDGDKTNNHQANLEWVTPRENTEHYWSNNIGRRGEFHHATKVTAQDVAEIRYLHHIKGLTQDTLREMYGQCVQPICEGKTWKHV